MAAKLVCPHCQARLNLPKELPESVEVLRCPQCKQGIPGKKIRELLAKVTTRLDDGKTKVEPGKSPPVKHIDPEKTELISGLADLDHIGLKEDNTGPMPSLNPVNLKTGSSSSLLPDFDGIKTVDDNPPAPQKAQPKPVPPSKQATPSKQGGAPPKKSPPPKKEELDNLEILDDDVIIEEDLEEIKEEEEFVEVEAAEEEEFVEVEAAEEEVPEAAAVEEVEEEVLVLFEVKPSKPAPGKRPGPPPLPSGGNNKAAPAPSPKPVQKKPIATPRKNPTDPRNRKD